MAAEDGTEEAVLHPAYVEFLELGILRCRTATLRVVGATEETTDVGIEVRTASQRVAQAGGYLLAQHVP